jgi:branched-chain amino acid transport system permease protein
MDILIYGTINSVALALYALGFALVYGISRLPNFAHGALYVLSGFIVWSALNSLGLSYPLSILTAMLVTALIGAAIYRLFLIRTLPAFISGSTTIAGISVDYQRLLVVGIGAALVVCLWLFTHYTRIGLALRGMAQDERAALMLGIDSDMMAVLAMGLGSMLAAVAAILLLPLGNIVVESGYNVLILAIAVCIVGGLGSWMGAVLAAFLIGFAQILTVVYLGSHYQMVVALLAIILTLILKPSGLFGQQKELEERV